MRFRLTILTALHSKHNNIMLSCSRSHWKVLEQWNFSNSSSLFSLRYMRMLGKKVGATFQAFIQMGSILEFHLSTEYYVFHFSGSFTLRENVPNNRGILYPTKNSAVCSERCWFAHTTNVDSHFSSHFIFITCKQTFFHRPLRQDVSNCSEKLVHTSTWLLGHGPRSKSSL